MTLTNEQIEETVRMLDMLHRWNHINRKDFEAAFAVCQQARPMTPAPTALPPEPAGVINIRNGYGSLLNRLVSCNEDDCIRYIDALRAAASGLVEENQRLKDGLEWVKKFQSLPDAALKERAEAAESAAKAARERVGELERERDKLWCEAIVQTQESEGRARLTCDVEKLLAYFNSHRPDAALPPSSETTKAL